MYPKTYPKVSTIRSSGLGRIFIRSWWDESTGRMTLDAHRPGLVRMPSGVWLKHLDDGTQELTSGGGA